MRTFPEALIRWAFSGIFVELAGPAETIFPPRTTRTPLSNSVPLMGITWAPTMAMGVCWASEGPAARAKVIRSLLGNK